MQEIAAGGQPGGGELVHEFVHLDLEGVVPSGGANPIRPCASVFNGQIEFAGDLDVQGAAAPQVVDDEVKFAHGLLAVLQLHAVGPQGEMGTG